MINNETIIYELCNKYQWFTCGRHPDRNQHIRLYREQK